MAKNASFSRVVYSIGLYSIGLCSGFLCCCQQRDQFVVPVTPVERELADSLSGSRWVEPRVSGVFNHTECFHRCENGRLLCEPDCSGSRKAARGHNSHRIVSKTVGKSEGATERQVEAILGLVSSRSEEAAQQAIQILQGITEEAPADARVRSDLAAAYIVRAQRGERPEDLVQALGWADEAIRVDGSLPAARFNRALALEGLSLNEAAVKAWNEYLILDQESGWAQEARQRRSALSSLFQAGWPPVRERLLGSPPADIGHLIAPFPTASRHFVEEEILPSWAEALSQGNRGEASQRLTTAWAIADKLADLGGDRLLADSVAAIEAAQQEATSQRLELLIEGHGEYGAAARNKVQAEQQSLKETAQTYRRIEQALRQARSPFHLWAGVELSILEYLDGRSDAALERLTQVKRLGSRYPNLRGRASWIEALCHLQLARPVEGLKSYRASLEFFEATGEVENALNIHARLAEVLQSIGEVRLAWRHRYTALKSALRIRQPRYRQFLFTDAAIAALDLGLPEIALLFQGEALRWSRLTGQDELAALAFVHHANACYRAGRIEEALEDLEAASRHASGLSDRSVQASIQARIKESRGLLKSVSDPAGSIEAYTQMLDLLEENADRGYLSNVYLKRALAHRSLGHIPEMKADLQASIQESENEWHRVLDLRKRGEHEDIWAPYFESHQEAFQLMIQLLVEEGRADEALNVAERSRARDLLDLIADLPRYLERQDFEPVTIADIQRHLPEGKALIVYRSLKDRLLIWIVTKDNWRFVPVSESMAEIGELVERIHKAALHRRPEEEVRPKLRKLFRLLLGALREDLRTVEKLVFVPDASLHGVPLAALIDPESERYLIESHTISIVPSATFYLHLTQRNGTHANAATSALVVGDPAFDPELFPGLKRLAGATAEAELVARLYQGSLHLSDVNATKASFLELAGQHAVVHFAGHAIPNFGSPFKSVLALAPSSSTAAHSGALYAYELIPRNLQKTRLVVLSACSTAAGHPIGALGVSSLVRPILGSGVSAVLASLWDVHDQATVRLLEAFHKRFSTGVSASNALRQAQLELLNGSNHALSSVFAWAPFQVIGEATLDRKRKE